MGIVGRIIQTGVVVTLHSGPGISGVLARSETLPASMFSEGQRHVVNQQRINTRATGTGRAQYVGIWIDGHMEGQGKINRRIQVAPGDEHFFPRGVLRVRMGAS